MMPLPQEAAEFLANRLDTLDNQKRVTHAGLLMDRLTPYGTHQCRNFDQKSQKQHIERIIKASYVGDADVLNVWTHLIKGMPGSVSWSQRTLWRLAGQLSRATTLENGSTALHPLYGFAYLPGSGLKGLARAWAHQEEASDSDILRIFGSSDVRNIDGEMKTNWHEESGSVTFLEAWPAQWPRLECDIVNNHHKDYYSSNGKTPPGDWEAPNPTYFLAIPTGTVFRFAVAPRDTVSEGAVADVKTAVRWLQEGLQYLGAGAKTAAGYGYFDAPKEIR